MLSLFQLQVSQVNRLPSILVRFDTQRVLAGLVNVDGPQRLLDIAAGTPRVAIDDGVIGTIQM